MRNTLIQRSTYFADSLRSTPASLERGPTDSLLHWLLSNELQTVGTGDLVLVLPLAAKGYLLLSQPNTLRTSETGTPFQTLKRTPASAYS